MRPSSCVLAFLLAAGFLAASPRPAAACSCSGGLTPCQAFASSPIVFVGEVLSVEKAGGDFHMRLRVVRGSPFALWVWLCRPTGRPLCISETCRPRPT